MLLTKHANKKVEFLIMEEKKKKKKQYPAVKVQLKEMKWD